jgi:hypothetical protein
VNLLVGVTVRQKIESLNYYTKQYASRYETQNLKMGHHETQQSDNFYCRPFAIFWRL